MDTTQRAFFEFMKVQKATITGFGNIGIGEGWCCGEIWEIGDDHIVIVEEYSSSNEPTRCIIHDLDSIRIEVPPYCDYKEFSEIHTFVNNYKKKKGVLE